MANIMKKSVFVFLKDDKKEAWQIMIEDPVNVCEKKKVLKPGF